MFYLRLSGEFSAMFGLFALAYILMLVG